MTLRLRMRRFQAAALLSGALMTASVAEMSGATPAPPDAAVKIANFTFNSQVVSVKAGTTVTWTNADDIPHTVVSNEGMFKSKVLDTGDHFSFTFAKPGQFGYFCSLHPHMTGTVIVKA